MAIQGGQFSFPGTVDKRKREKWLYRVFYMRRYFNVIIASDLFPHFYSRRPPYLSNSSFLLVLWVFDDYRSSCFVYLNLSTNMPGIKAHVRNFAGDQLSFFYLDLCYCCLNILASWHLFDYLVDATLKPTDQRPSYFIRAVYTLYTQYRTKVF